MTRERYQHIKSIFYEVAGATAEDRPAVLERACGADNELRCEVEKLFASQEFATPSPHRQLAEATTGVPVEGPGMRIGDYTLLEPLGEGGFGAVFLAQQERPVRRQVALKIIKPGMDTKQVVARFEQERQSLAMMDHVNIARVFDAGVTSNGRPYFVMELVRGVPIGQYCDNNTLMPRQRLELFSQVCQAVQHAHQKGIIHRDIKTSNVLVATQDDRPVPKVIDFGIAKATNLDLAENTLITTQNQFMGTPAYMSPEQASNSSDIDTRTDVYSLGVLLYELLTGTTPFDVSRLLHAGPAGVQRILCDEEPQKPSTRLSGKTRSSKPRLEPDSGPQIQHFKVLSVEEIAKRRQMEPATLRKALRGDLDVIVMKCLEKDRTRRYATASAIVDDIQRYLTNEPVLARPPSTLYTLRKFAARNRWPMVLVAAVVVFTLAGLIGTSMGLRRANVARVQADANAERALRLAYSANMLSASDALERGQFDTARQYLNSAPMNLRGWEWRHLASRLDLSAQFHRRTGPTASQVHVLSDGKSYCELGHELPSGIRRYDIESGQLLSMTPLDKPCWQSWLVNAGTQLVVVLGERPGGPFTIEMWDIKRGSRLTSQSAPTAIILSGDGSLMAYVDRDIAHVVELKSGERRTSSPITLSVTGAQGSLICFQPDGKRLALGRKLGEIVFFDLVTKQIEEAIQPTENQTIAMTFSPDSRLLAFSSLDRTIQIFSAAKHPPRHVATLRGHASIAQQLCFSPDGSLLASLSIDKTLRLWDARTGAPRGVFASDGGSICFDPDGQWLIVGNNDGVRFFNVDAADAWTLHGHQSYVYSVLLSPDGGTIYSGGWDGFVGRPGSLRVWDTASGDLVTTLGNSGSSVRAAALSADGSRLAAAEFSTGRDPPRIEVFDTVSGAIVRTIPNTGNGSEIIDSLAFSPTGQQLFWANQPQQTAFMADIATGEIRTSPPLLPAGDGPTNVAWSPDGRLVAACKGTGEFVTLLDSRTLEPLRQWRHRHKGIRVCIAFSPDGQHLLTAGEDALIRVWDLASGNLIHELIGHTNRVFCAAYSPDGKRIASGSDDNNILIWNAETFEPVARLSGHEDYVYSLAWSPDSQQLVSGSGDHTVRVWDTQTMQERVKARSDRKAILTRIEPLVRKLFDRFGEATKVAAALRADPSLNERERQVALQVVLRISVEKQQQSPGVQ